jgi:Ca2+-binding RTX toxin-like protein
VPIQYQATNSIGAGVRITLDPAADLVVVGGATVGSTDDTAILGTGGDHDVQIFGTVSGHFSTLLFSGEFTNNVVRVMEGGFLYSGASAIQFASTGNQVYNNGGIFSDSDGINFGGNFLGGRSFVYNTGTIQASNNGIVATNSSPISLTNTGEIVSGGDAFDSDEGADEVFNLGLMVGNVRFGDGDDLLDNRGGEIQGTVFGETGKDTFFAGAGAETFDGGAGVDTLDFRGSDGLRVSLADDSGTGLAQGDVYISIETVFGSRGGADTLIGNASANNLSGFGGNDVLSGGGGRDILEGGIGADILTGGSGLDLFRYRNAAEGGDTIKDFNAASDAFRISANGFGGGLVADTTLAASQFQTRADNLAQDADDRFIFRTTDQTLWFDVNGSDAGGLTMIADLQNGAVVTHLDILLV